VPQSSMNREITPARIMLGIHWDQINDDWNITLVCYSQAETVQESFAKRLPDGFKSIELGVVLMRAFVDWLDSTPTYTRLQLAKALEGLSPTEVPVGVTPREVFRATDPSLGGRPGYTKRQFKPRRN
jgi:hypothetical protein